MQDTSETVERNGVDRVVRQRIRMPISCTECRRRKQKCNQAKDRPCDQCARRYPPVHCTYNYPEKKFNAREDEDDEAANINMAEIGVHGFNETIEYLEPPRAHNRLVSLPKHPKPLLQHNSTVARRDPTHNYLRRQLKKENYPPNYQVEFDSTYVRVTINPYLLPRRVQATFGCPETFDERIPILVEPLQPLPVEYTPRNAELFHFFYVVLSNFIGAIDGFNQSKLITEVWLPWMAKSPILAWPAMLSSSCFQAEARGIDVSTFPEAIAIRGRIIKDIGEYLKTNLGRVSDEAIAAVMHMVVNEWYHGDEKSQLAHMRGLQEMLKIRGGLENLKGNSFLSSLIVITDYEVAVTCERDLALHEETDPTLPVPVLDSYPIMMESPLLQSNSRFVGIHEILDISKPTAEILDDMRFLTCSIISVSSNEQNLLETTKILTTARWIHNRVTALPSAHSEGSLHAGDFIYESMRITALIYTQAILNRTPLSKSCDMPSLVAFWAATTRITLSRWKQISGIYIWMCMVMAPSAQWSPFGRFLKSMVSSTATYVGLVDWDVMMGYFRGCVRVMRWLNGKGSRRVLGA